MQTAQFRVQQELFNGPLDLLLYLVRKHEIDSLELQLGKIARDYLEFLAVLQWIDVDLVGDFLVAASTLAEIKSRLALPQEVEADSSADELIAAQPDGQLIHQLLEYRRFKTASRALEEQAAVWRERYPRLADDRPRRSKDPRHDHIKEVELWDLVSAFSRIVRKKVTESHGQIRYEETPISVYSDRIRARIASEGRVAFSSFFEGERVRNRIVGIFLAILELIRHHSYRAEQPGDFGEIWVLPPAPHQPPSPSSETAERETAEGQARSAGTPTPAASALATDSLHNDSPGPSVAESAAEDPPHADSDQDDANPSSADGS